MVDRVSVTPINFGTTAASTQRDRESVLDDSTDDMLKDEFFVIDDPFNMLNLDLKFSDECAEAKMMIPDEQVLRPFFFMRLIQKSISDGAFLSSTLFVPKFVWHQKAAQISDIERKMQCFNELRRELR